MQIFDLS